jgi:hypothetical protein
VLVPETRLIDLGQGKGAEGRDAPISATARSTRPNEPHHITRPSRKKGRCSAMLPGTIETISGPGGAALGNCRRGLPGVLLAEFDPRRDW